MSVCVDLRSAVAIHISNRGLDGERLALFDRALLVGVLHLRGEKVVDSFE